MAARMEMERLGLGRLERLDLRSFWGEQLPDLTPWFVQNVDLLGQTLGIDITPMQRDHQVDGSFNVLGTDALGRPIVIENRLEEADHNQLGELIMHASTLESAVIVWVSPRFDLESRRTLEWLNDRTDSKVDFFGVELGLVRIGRSLPAPVLDVVVQPRNWRKPGRRQNNASAMRAGQHHEPPPVPATGPLLQPPLPAQASAPGRHQHHESPPPMASDKDGGFQTAEVRHLFFEAMFDAVVRRRPGFRIPKFGNENWVGFAAGPFGFYDVAFTANGAVRAGVYLDMQERNATKRLFDDLFAERLGIETAVGRILSWERLDDRRASRIVDYREVRDLANPAEQRMAADWAAETVVKLMDALDGRLRSTAQVLLARVQGGV